MSLTPKLKPAAVTKRDLDRLMHYHDWQFVDVAYQLILARPVDDTGLANNLTALRSGESRREIAYRLGTSEEARSRGFDPRLFDSYLRWRRVEKLPVIGAIFLLILCLKRIRFLVREFRRIQNATYTGVSQANRS